MQHIVIVGGGFAGVNFTKKLSENKGFEITLVDRNNYNFFPPLLYQVATGFLEPANISYPFRKLFRKSNCRFRMGEFQKVIPDKNKIVLSTGELFYDRLVFATGAEANYFGMENVKKNALPMKTLNDALELRNHFLEIMERASNNVDENERTKLLTIVVAGGGPTGVEVSGMLAEMRKRVVPKDYPELNGIPQSAHIYLVDGSTEVLGPMSKRSQCDTYAALAKLGVVMKLGYSVQDYSNGRVNFANGEGIDTETLVWAAGVKASIYDGVPKQSYGRGGRLIVDAFNKVKGLENIYAIGDTCLQKTDPHFPDGHPQLAQVAIQQGRALAKNLILMLKEAEPKAFKYWDKGTMAIIGRNKAVVDLPKPKLHLKGFIAWFMWLFIHLFFLINYRNSIRSLYNWIVAYFTKDQTLRLIIRPTKK